MIKKEYPIRKRTRLKKYDYSSPGLYFVTICTSERKQLLSSVIDDSRTSAGNGDLSSRIHVKLKKCGEIANDNIKLLCNRFSNVTLFEYVIMPDHIHLILQIKPQNSTENKAISLSSVICSFKSIVSKECKSRFGVMNLFQRSFSDHIIRDKEDYETRKTYILNNPIKWYYNNLNSEE